MWKTGKRQKGKKKEEKNKTTKKKEKKEEIDAAWADLKNVYNLLQGQSYIRTVGEVASLPSFELWFQGQIDFCGHFRVKDVTFFYLLT